MSLAYYNQPHTFTPACDEERLGAHKDIDLLTRYLAILEDNKRACRFIPDDVAVSLDMAGSVRDRLDGRPGSRGISTARLALSLIQPSAPLQ